jgi:hypothetical protein
VDNQERSMKSNPHQWAESFAIAGLLGVFLLAFPELRDVELMAGVSSAAGTVWAVMVALKLARSQDAKKAAEDMQRAALASAGIAPSLTEAVESLSRFFASEPPSDGYAHPDGGERLRQNQQHDIERIEEVASYGAWLIDLSTIEKLIPLPNKAAHNLHVGCTLLLEIKQEVAQLRSGPWPTSPNDARERWLARWHGRLTVSQAVLNDAIKEIRQASGVIEAIHLV